MMLPISLVLAGCLLAPLLCNSATVSFDAKYNDEDVLLCLRAASARLPASACVTKTITPLQLAISSAETPNFHIGGNQSVDVFKIVLKGLCKDANCFAFGMPSPQTGVKLATELFTRLHYQNVMLINNAHCSWLDTPTALQLALSEAQNENLTLHAHGLGVGPTARCSDLEHAKYSVYGLHPNTIDDAVTALVDLQRAGGLSDRHWLFFNEDGNAVSWMDIIAELMRTDDGRRVAAWLNGHSLRTNTYPPAAAIAAQLSTTGLSDADVLALTTRPELSRMVDSLLYGLRVSNAAECANLPAAQAYGQVATVTPGDGLSWTGDSLSNAPYYLRQPSLSDNTSVRALIHVDGVDQPTFEYFGPAGQPSSRPYLMLDGNPNLYPVDSLPVKLPLTSAFGRTNPTFGQDSTASSTFLLAATEFFNAKHGAFIELGMTVQDTYPTSCTAVAEDIEASNTVAVCGAITSECSVAMMEVFRKTDYPQISPGSSTSILSDINRYPSFFRTTPSAVAFGQALARMTHVAGFDCAVVVTDVTRRVNLETTASFSAEASRIGVNVAGEFVVPSELDDRDGYRQLLLNVWDQGVGVIVVSLYEKQATLLMELADELGMLDVNFVWYMSQLAGTINSWASTIKDKLSDKMLTFKVQPPDLTEELAQEFLAFDSSFSHQSYIPLSISRPYTIRFADDVAMLVHVALQELDTFGFGRDVNLTRAAIKRGLSQLVGKDKAIPGVSIPKLWFSEDQSAVLETGVFTVRNRTLFPAGHINASEAILDRSIWSGSGFSCIGPSRAVEGGSRADRGTGLSIGATAALATTLVALLVIIVLLMIFIRRNSRAKRRTAFDFKPLVEKLSESLTLSRDPVVPKEIPRRCITIHGDERLGKGAFGTVFAGTARLAHGKDGPEVADVAIKVLKTDVGEIPTEHLHHESVILSQFDNEQHIVKLYGVVTIGQPGMIIMEHCEQGSLYDYLKRRFDSDRVLLWQDKLKLCADVANGMRAVAAAGCIHTDLAARNVLMKGGVAKVCDFGLSKSSRYYLSRCTKAVPLRWMAPEALDGLFSSASDVWSFGILMWEVATNCQSMPYPTMSSALDVATAVKNGYRLGCPLLCPEQIFAVMASCWRARELRPTFDQLKTILLSMVNAVGHDSLDLDPPLGRVLSHSVGVTPDPSIRPSGHHDPSSLMVSPDAVSSLQVASPINQPDTSTKRHQLPAQPRQLRIVAKSNQAERQRIVDNRDYHRLTLL
eukprot:m.31352 g.31352  ORF g.31352 m.31352 type:complete len:1235 (+) comp12063_c0_seq1:159-3863(+)